jgi:hypothetical protein
MRLGRKGTPTGPHSGRNEEKIVAETGSRRKCLYVMSTLVTLCAPGRLPGWDGDNQVPDEVDGSCTTRQHKTHKTDLQDVCYPWHPWHGQKVTVHETVAKPGQAVFRCSIQERAAHRRLEIPDWMFDRALCCTMRPGPMPWVGVEHLRQLQQLLQVVSGSGVVEEAHRSHQKGNADAPDTPCQNAGSVGPFPSSTAKTDLGSDAGAGDSKGRRTARRTAAAAPGEKASARKSKGGRR